MPPTPFPALSGTCLCGQVTFQSTTLPTTLTICHCTTCRKASGAPFLAFGLFPNPSLRFLTPTTPSEPPIKIRTSPPSPQGASIAVRGSCGDCGSPLFMKYHCCPDDTYVVMGAVDDASVVGEIVRVSEHIFLGERAGWWEEMDGGDDGVARHEGFSGPFRERLDKWYEEGCPRRGDVGVA